MATTLIKNGRVISTTGVIAQDVLIVDETVAAVGGPGYFAAVEGDAVVLDAAGKYVIPGGVDVHTHMELPFGGTFASDTFETGSRAAAWGGVTTIIDMAVQRYGENDFYGQSYFVDPEGKFVGDVGDPYKPELVVRDLDLDKIKLVRDRWAFYRDRRPDAYDELVER